MKDLQGQYGGFKSYTHIHEGKGHWMDKEDSHLMKQVLGEVRNPYPDDIVFRQHSRTKKPFFYYIEVEPN